LAEGLPRLGIPGAYLALHEDPEKPAEWSRLMLAYDEEGRVGLDTDGVRFPSPQLVPKGIWPQERRYSFIVSPLSFQGRQLGFVLYEMGPREGSIYDGLREEISSGLQGAQLVEQVENRAVQLQTAAEVSRAAISTLELSALLQQVVGLVQERFDLYYVGLFLVSGEPDGDRSDSWSAWAVLRAASGEGGAQMLEQGHRLAVGSESMIGQCIADHQPRIASDVGEEAVRFNNPLLPETHSELALPLITREGAIGALSVQSTERAAFGEAEIAVFETLAGQLANAIANARVYEQVAQAYTEIQVLNERLKDENLRMGAELAVTQRLQQMLLPTEEELRQIEDLDIAGFMEPAEEVGGDYYDVLNHNGQIKIGIGDVTGHGLESGVVMLMLQTAVRTLMTSDEQDPVRFMSILNRLLQENTQRMQVNKSMTLALLDYQLGRMRVSGQHEQVIVVRRGGQVELKDTLDLGFPLGLMSGVAEFVQEMTIDLQPGDGVVLYSDGITEAENEAEEFYGLERLCRVVSEHWEEIAEEVRDSVVADVKAFIGSHKVYDDITLVVVKQK
jgi:serine phosphatase RsbU (regulator of sigma subunit)/putative methionine-R-sulfoxide reductase with GAF domain